jgi:hypothetical protein
MTEKLFNDYTVSQEGPQCPYCLSQIREADDPCYYDDNNFIEFICEDCGSTSKAEVYRETTWTLTKVEQ